MDEKSATVKDWLENPREVGLPEFPAEEAKLAAELLALAGSLQPDPASKQAVWRRITAMRHGSERSPSSVDPLLSRFVAPLRTAWGMAMVAAAILLFALLLAWGMNLLVPQPLQRTEEPPAQTPAGTSRAVSSTATPPAPPAQNLGALAYLQDGSLWVKELPMGEPRRLAQAEGEPRWSPSGVWIAFRRGEEQVWLTDSRGEIKFALNQGKRVGAFAWAPGQDLLAYVAGENEVRLYDPDLEEESLLVPHIENRRTLDLAWSPDGAWIALHWFEPSPEFPPYSAIWLVSPQGELKGDMHNGDPQLSGWTGDGSALLVWDSMFSDGDRGEWAFSASLQADGIPLGLLIPLESYKPQVLAERVLVHDDFVRPDPSGGERVAVVVGGGRGTWTEKVLHLFENGSGERVSPPGAAVSSPAWSPNGRYLAYASSPDAELSVVGGESARQALMQRRIWLLDLQDRQPQPRRLTDDPAYRDEYPLWSADGSWLLFARMDDDSQTSLWLVPAMAGEPHQVVEGLSVQGGWFGYYGHLDWDKSFDWWRGATGKAPPSSEPTPAPTLTGPSSEQESRAQPYLRFGAGRVQRVALSPDGNLVGVGSSTGVCLFGTASWEERWCSQADPRPMGGVISLEFDPQSTAIAAGTWNGAVTLWEVGSREPRWHLDTTLDNIRCLAWSPDGKRLIAGADDGKASVLDAETGRVLKSLRAGWPSVLAAAWSPDGALLATGDFFGEVVIWETSKYQRQSSFEAPDAWNVTSIVWSSDGSKVIVGFAFEPGCGEGCNPVYDGMIIVIDAASGEEIRRIETGSPVKGLAFQPDGAALAAGMWNPMAADRTGDGAVWLVVPESGEQIAKLPGGRADLGLDWFPQGDRLLLGGEAGRLTVLEAGSGEQKSLTLEGYQHLNGLAWSPDGLRLAASSSDGALLIFDGDSGAVVSQISPVGNALTVAWSSSGNLLASVGEQISIWDENSGDLLRLLPLPRLFLSRTALVPRREPAGNAIHRWAADPLGHPDLGSIG